MVWAYFGVKKKTLFADQLLTAASSPSGGMGAVVHLFRSTYRLPLKTSHTRRPSYPVSPHFAAAARLWLDEQWSFRKPCLASSR